MISFNDQQLTKIKRLRPLADSKYKYDTSKWNNLNVGLKNLIHDFNDKDITRQNVVDAYRNYFQDNGIGVRRAVLLTMVWGFAGSGYGAYRTNNFLCSEENVGMIKNAIDHVNRNDEDLLKKAFKELMKIKGLGVSYLTKILYFATRAQHRDDYALIFDIRVAASLVKLTTPKEIFQIVNVGPSSKFNNYQTYNKLIHILAKDNNVEADQLEMYLFDQDF
jgi:hypothetical protein